MVRLRLCLWTLAFLTATLSMSWSQASSEAGPDNRAATDQEVESQTDENPSNSQPARPSIDPLPESRSMFLAGVFVGESAQAVPAFGQARLSQTTSFTRVLGSLNFLKIKSRSQTIIDYRGGGFFDSAASTSGHLQDLQAMQRFFWHKAALTISDSLRNFPGGSFGETWFGGASAYTLGTTNVGPGLPIDPGIAAFIGSSNFSGFGQSALTNLALAELTETLTSRSAITVAGAYGKHVYFGNNPGFINSQQIAALANYGYQLTPLSEIGLVYGYRDFQFPQSNAGTITTQVAQLAYTRILSRRLQLQAGAGPEFSRISTPLVLGIPPLQLRVTVVTHQINVSAYGALAYRMHRAMATLSYDRLVTNGSGLFAGANTDIGQFSIVHTLGQAWETSFDLGYIRLTRIQQASSLIPGNSYQYGFAGAGVARRIGPLRILASYQFNDESFDASVCHAAKSCNGLEQRHIGLIGIYWHTRPYRLDRGSRRADEDEKEMTLDEKTTTGGSDVPSSDH